jgi:hypothetical protein
MMRGNFFNPATLNGIWLAGDYSGEAILKSVRIPVENDTVPDGSGQAITTKEMSRMFQLIHTQKGLSTISDATDKAASRTELHALLQAEGSWFQNTTAGVTISVPIFFTVDCAKVGIGTLGPIGSGGPNVYSEGSGDKWKTPAEVTAFNSKFSRKLTGDFVVCWQNLYQLENRIDSLTTIVNNAIRNFLTQ